MRSLAAIGQRPRPETLAALQARKPHAQQEFADVPAPPDMTRDPMRARARHGVRQSVSRDLADSDFFTAEERARIAEVRRKRASGEWERELYEMALKVAQEKGISLARGQRRGRKR
jgi:hypothetical protein